MAIKIDMFNMERDVNHPGIWNVVIKNPNPIALNNLPKEIKLNLKVILSRQMSDILASDLQFKVLNQFLDYKGEQFKEDLYKKYMEAYDYIDLALYSSKPEDKDGKDFKDYFYRILDMFKLGEIRHFLTDIFKLHIPNNLSAKFDVNIEKDNRGFEERTYLQSDYQYLIDFTVFVKATYPLLIMYGELISRPTRQNANREKSHDDGFSYKLTIFYRNYPPLHNFPAINKIRDFVQNLYDSLEKNELDKAKISITKNLSPEEIVEHAIADIIITKVTVTKLNNNDDDRSIVSGFYNYINNKFNQTKVLENNFKAGGDKDSNIESYRMVMDLPLGMVQTACFFTNSIEGIYEQLPPQQQELIKEGMIINTKHYSVEDVRALVENLKHLHIHNNTLILTSIIFKYILTPKYVEYLNLSNMLNLITLGGIYLFNSGHLELADLYLSGYSTTLEDGAITINATTNKSRVGMDDIQELSKYFPLKKFPNKTKTDGELIIKSWVETYANSFYKHTWKHAFTGENVLIPSNIKILISKFLIDHEKLLYGPLK